MINYINSIKNKIPVNIQLFTLSIIILCVLALIEYKTSTDEKNTHVAQDFINNHYFYNSINQHPIHFEKNMGQADPDVSFIFRNPELEMLLSPTKAIMSFRHPSNGHESRKILEPSVSMRLANSKQDANGKGLSELVTKTNYLRGNDPAKWHSSIPNYERVKFSEVYPGIDLVYYGKNGELEYDFNISPGHNPDIIELMFEKDTELNLDLNGDLVIRVDSNSLIIHAPLAYQELDGERFEVVAQFYQREENIFGFEIGEYDKSIPLVIDPVIEFSSFLVSSWKAEDIAVDKDGFAYITGDDCCDVFVTKLHPDSTDLIYKTYLGGDLDDFGLGIAVDTAGSVYVTGETQSNNFPLQNAIQSDFGGLLWVDGDAFVTKLNKEGSIIYSTYLGGEGSDIGHDIAVDLSGNAYIIGETNSANFPVENAYQSTQKNYEHEVFVTKLNADGSAFVFSTFLGGMSDEEGHAIALDTEQNIYLTGFTFSSDFPTTQNSYLPNGYPGTAFVTKMKADGTDLIFSTYLSAGNDPNNSNVVWGTGIAVNNLDEIYVVGKTFAIDFPMVNAIQQNNAGGMDGFVAKLKADGSDLMFSTYLGGAAYEDNLKIALDADSKVFITGQTGSDNFPVVNPIQANLKGYIDAFVTGISSDGKEMFFSTYLGGSDWDQGRGVAVADNAHIFVTGHTNSNDFLIESPIKNTSLGAYVTEISFDDKDISWKNRTNNYSLPDGISVFEGTRISPKLKIFYIDADLNRPDLSIRPYMRGSKQTVKAFNNNVGAYASVNGGFFYKTKILSAVYYPGELKATNIDAVNRNSKSYPVIRSLFSMKKDKSFSVDWIYHISNQIFTNEIFTYENPLAYIRDDQNPKPVPSADNGKLYSNILTGIGGGPVLIKDGSVRVTYDEEIMWDSGVEYDKRDPRTAVGYTANKHVIMLVADGRSDISEGVGLPELAEIMKKIGCVEALNLDGGGSSQMAIGNSFINNPSDPVARVVPSILSVVHADSLNLNKTPLLNYMIDTEASNIEKVGDWTESTSAGAYGSSNALIIPSGEGNNYISYNLEITKETEYEVYAWWVSEADRSRDAPYIINHKNGIDTVRMDQSDNGSFWNIIGNYTFTGANTDKLTITDGGTTGGFVCADAIRIVSSDKITDLEENSLQLPVEYRLLQNYPNPFNPKTIIKYSIPSKNNVIIKITDLLGREIITLVNKEQPQGNYQLEFEGSDLTSGIYFYSIHAGEFVETKKMLLIK